ncbi:MAG: regulatory protein GemA [Desulfuromonadales bacterium]|nr:regulatory protein GemA [Desulfuromonadales bacterium]
MKKPTIITAAQIKKIHVLKGSLALDNDTYRAMLAEQFRVASSKELSSIQATAFITDLEQKAVAAGLWEKRNTFPAKGTRRNQVKKFEDLEARRGNMASPAQLRKIEAQWSDVTRAETPETRKKALRHFLERVAKISDLRFLDAAGAGKVINALTVMQRQVEPGKRKKAV